MLFLTDELLVNNSDAVVFQAALLDLYLKTVLMSKTRPYQHILVRTCGVCCIIILCSAEIIKPKSEACFQEKSGPMLRHMSHAEFKEQLLPSLQKALLRSPENSMQSESQTTTLSFIRISSLERSRWCSELIIRKECCCQCYLIIDTIIALLTFWGRFDSTLYVLWGPLLFC